METKVIIKFIKYALYCVLLGFVAYKSLFIIEPHWETFGYARGGKYINLILFISAFVISDLWLHHFKMRVIGIAVFVSLCLFGVNEYRYCKENNLLFEEMGRVELGCKTVSICEFEEYWKLNGLLAGYLFAGIGVSSWISRTKGYYIWKNKSL